MRLPLVGELNVMTVSGSGISEVYAEDLPIFCVALGNLLCPEDLNLAATSPLANLRVAALGQSDRRAHSLPSSFPRPIRDGSTSSPSGTE